VLSAIRLAMRFDAAALAADSAALAADDWVPHFNTAYYRGDWSGVALRSVGGEAGRLYPDPTAEGEYAPTAALERSPALAAALGRFRCSLLAARLLRLGPGARIREHTDYNLGYEDGELRVHVPVTTGPEVEFMHDGRRVEMLPGEAWYLDLNLAHSVANRGDTARVHLVVDCVVNDWLEAQLEQGAGQRG
jgi:Aspartyl/Asparaginyl beta-hydroxylase